MNEEMNINPEAVEAEPETQKIDPAEVSTQENPGVGTANSGKNKKSKKKHTWGKFLLCWAAALLVLGAIGCGILYDYLRIYEEVRPEKVMDALLAENSVDTWRDYALTGLSENLTIYDDPEILKADYAALYLTGDSVTYMKDPIASGDDVRVYRVRMNSRDMAFVTLTPKSETRRYHLKEWEISSIEPADTTEYLNGVTVEISALPETEVLLNGILLDESTIANPNLPIDTLTPFEAQMETPPCLSLYRVENLYGTITLSDSNGAVYTPVSTDDSLIAYNLSDLAQEVTVTAPNIASVFVNGVPVTEDAISGKEESLLTELDAYTHGADYYLVTYDLGRLYGTPEITAKNASGEDLIVTSEDAALYEVTLPEDEALREEHLELVQTFFDKFVIYSTRSYSSPRLCDLLTLVVKGSNLDSYLRSSKRAMEWAPSNSTITYRKLEFIDFHAVSDDCFMCTISYCADYSAVFYSMNYDKTLENTYEMVFVKTAYGWQAAEMNILNE